MYLIFTLKTILILSTQEMEHIKIRMSKTHLVLQLYVGQDKY
jgi:hypothetical protein